MPSERIQRQIDAALDEAESALAGREWEIVREPAAFALMLNPENEDAVGLHDAADRGLQSREGSSSGASANAQPAPAAPQLPDSFAGGRYRVERFLGEGGKKRVFLAHDTTLDRDVAFGQFRTEGMDAAGRARVTQEAQAMGRVGAHPNLVTIYDIGEEAGAPFIVQEYVSGGSASDLVGDEPPPLEQTLQLASDVCEALSFIHNQNLVHRDIKPSNVFLTEDGSAKVGDFGLAVGLDRTRITMPGGMIGTPSYMPPEQALGGDVTPQSDLYSLGAMLYELVTGRPPFLGDDPTSVISQHINTPPVAPSWHSEHCPPDLEELILRCLAKSPDDCPESAPEVLDALARVDPEARSTTHSDSGANPLDRLARGVFVGREAELTRLRSAFDEAYAGRGNLVMLVGEPGCGRTRTVREVETYARMRGARILVAQVNTSEGMAPYGPWIDAARGYIETSDRSELPIDPGVAAELQPIIPELAQFAGTVADSVPSADPETAQFRMYDAYTRFIASISGETPLVVVFDDLHLADRPSLSLLSHVARSLPQMRVLLVGTYCDAAVSHAHQLSEVLAVLRRNPGYERVRLRGLDPDDVAQALSETIAGDIPLALAEAIHRRTEGNPLFVHEVLRHATEEGRLAPGDWVTAADSLERQIPEGLRDVVGMRLERLSPRTGELLATAAVIGREFELEVLLAVSEESVDDLAVVLEEAASALVIEEISRIGGARYRFTHALFQQVLYEDLVAPRRIGLHLEVARAVEAQHSHHLDERSAELAEHYSHSSDRADLTKAVDYGRRAARRSASVFAHEETVRLLEQALAVQAVLDAGDGVARCALLLELGSALLAADQPSRAEADVAEEAFTLAESAGMDDDAAAACSIALKGIAAVGGVPMIQSGRGQKWIARAERHITDQSLQALRKVSLAFAETGKQRSKDLRRALDTARDLGEAEAFHFAAWACLSGASMDRTDEDALIDEVLARADDDIWTGWRACSVSTAAATLTKRLDRDGADELFGRIATMYERAPGAIVTGHWTGNEVGRLASDGQLEEAVELALTQPVEAGGTWVRMMMTRPLLLLGRARDYLGVEGRTPGVWDAHIYARAGMDAEARAALAADSFDALPLGAALMALDGALLLDDRDSIRALTERVLEVWAPLTTLTWETVTDRHVAEAFAYLGEPDSARERYEAAIEVAEGMRWRPEVALARFGLTNLLFEHDPDVRTEALEHLAFAINEFGEMKMAPHLEEALRLRLQLQGAEAADAQASLVSLTTNVEAQRPDVGSAVAPDGTVTLLFSDIEDSTAMNVELGDDAWRSLLDEHDALCRRAIAAHDGYEVKTVGDAFMVAFGSARAAVRCAREMQQAMTERNGDAEHSIRIRIGLHTGEPVQQADDFYGTDVVLASRLCSAGDGGDILVSPLLRDLVASSGEFELTAREPVALKGLDGEYVTYMVGWA